MRMSQRGFSVLTLCLTIGVAYAAFGPEVSQACPFCSAPVLTLVEQYEKADASVVATWVSSTKPEENRSGKTTYRIVKLLNDPTGKLKVGGDLTIDRYRTGKTNDQFLMMATKEDSLVWGSPIEATPELVDYLTGIPRGKSSEQRMTYFLKFLEHKQDDIASDAYAQFANAPYKEIVPLAKHFPRDNLRKWVSDPATQQTRMGLYGLMLGLCGGEEDARAMEKRIIEPVKKDDFRLGIDGVMGGYLLLTGEAGLAKLEQMKLKDKEMPFSEVYSVMQALRFLWSYSPGKIAPDRLRTAMRLLLDRPELADLVIADLARWKDWSVQERLFQIYGQGEYNIPSTKRAIIRFMLVSQRDIPTGSRETPPYVTRGREYMESLRKKDPKMVADVERFPPL